MPGKELIHHLYIKSRVSRSLEGLCYFALITSFAMLLINQITCSLNV